MTFTGSAKAPHLPAAQANGCRGCGHDHVEPLLDLGAQPPSNRFLVAVEERVERHPLRLAQCPACALVQLDDAMPVRLTRPRVGWLRYNEPEAHLDAVCEALLRLPGLPAQPHVLGVSYKDESTLQRLRGAGAHDRGLDLQQDWGVTEPHAQLETLQQAITPERCAGLAQRHGQADLVIARHILEHAHAPRMLLAGMLALLKPGGYLVFEVPAAERMIAAADHALLWEEHVSYFTEATLARFFNAAGLAVSVSRHPFALEDSLVAVVRNAPGAHPAAQPAPAELAAGRAFAAAFDPLRAAYQRQMHEWSARGQRIALFGAGHLAVKFVNFYGLSDFIDCAVDDNPHKQGTWLPGSCLPVAGSTVLRESRMDICLLALNPDREAAVISSQPVFTARGGTFRSIFRCSSIALQPWTNSSR